MTQRDDTPWTIGDALEWLEPTPPRRTLSRWLEQMTPIGTARLPQGGPLARTYPSKQIILRHAQWVNTRAEWREDAP